MVERRIESDITNLTKDINRLEMGRQGEIGGERKRKIKKLNAKYRVKEKGINLVNKELNQRLVAKKTKVKRHEQRISQFRQNQLFQVSQKQVYIEPNAEKQGERIIPNSEKSMKMQCRNMSYWKSPGKDGVQGYWLTNLVMTVQLTCTDQYSACP